MLLLAALSRKFAGDGQALRATLLTAGAPLFAGLSAYVIFDMPLALCVTTVWLGLARELTAGLSNRRRAWMYAALALGVLLKGPIMFGLGARRQSRRRAGAARACAVAVARVVARVVARGGRERRLVPASPCSAIRNTPTMHWSRSRSSD